MFQARKQTGFTLIEVMVVVGIVALISAISVFALQQATKRPNLSEAERMQSWLQDLSDRALLNGIAHGVRANEDGLLQGMVFYRQHWFLLDKPEPFVLSDEALIQMPESLENERRERVDDDVVLPSLVLSGNGFEPEEGVTLRFDQDSQSFSYQWDGETGKIFLVAEVR